VERDRITCNRFCAKYIGGEPACVSEITISVTCIVELTIDIVTIVVSSHVVSVYPLTKLVAFLCQPSLVFCKSAVILLIHSCQVINFPSASLEWIS